MFPIRLVIAVLLTLSQGLICAQDDAVIEQMNQGNLALWKFVNKAPQRPVFRPKSKKAEKPARAKNRGRRATKRESSVKPVRAPFLKNRRRRLSTPQTPFAPEPQPEKLKPEISASQNRQLININPSPVKRESAMKPVPSKLQEPSKIESKGTVRELSRRELRRLNKQRNEAMKEKMEKAEIISASEFNAREKRRRLTTSKNPQLPSNRTTQHDEERSRPVPLAKERVPIQTSNRIRSKNRLKIWNFAFGIRNFFDDDPDGFKHDSELTVQLGRNLSKNQRVFVEHKDVLLSRTGSGKLSRLGVGYEVRIPGFFDRYPRLSPYASLLIDYWKGRLAVFNNNLMSEGADKSIQIVPRLGFTYEIGEDTDLDVYLEKGGGDLTFIDVAGNTILIEARAVLYGLGVRHSF